VAIVGYTNVGKSTLMNLITKTDILAENKLFATVDSPSKKSGFLKMFLSCFLTRLGLSVNYYSLN